MATAISVSVAVYLALIAAAWRSRTLATDTQDRHDTRVHLGNKAAESQALEHIEALYRQVADLGRPVTSPSNEPAFFTIPVQAFLETLKDSSRLQATYDRLLVACRILPLLLATLIVTAPAITTRLLALWGAPSDQVSVSLYVVGALLLLAVAADGALIILYEQRLPAQASKHVRQGEEQSDNS